MSLEEKSTNNPELFYSNLKKLLEEVQKFPTDYTFKFIYPTANNSMNEVNEIFCKANARITSKESSNGKYTSVTVVLYVIDSDEIIAYYKKVSKIKDIIML